MKKFFVLMAVASMGVMANAQSVEELQAKKADIDNQIANYDDGIAKKWEFRFDLMGETNFEKEDPKQGTLGWEEALGGNLGVGYNFNSNFYAGIASGYYHKIGSSFGITAPSYIPALLDLTYRWNFGEKEKWSFFLQALGGYCFGINSNEKYCGTVDYEYPNALYLDVQPGIYYRIKPNMDLKFSVGYAHISPDDDTPDLLHSTNMLMAKIGMNFRKASKMPARSVLLAESALLAEQIEAARLAAEEAARQAALKAAQEEAARKAAEEAARKAAEEEAARLAALEAAKHKELTLFYEIRLSDLTAEHNAQLDELVEWVNSRKIDKIVVKGYADRETGNPRLNVGYAKSRAEKVKKALVKKYKIDKNIIECSSYGDTEQPFNENVKNRCTIILVNEID